MEVLDKNEMVDTSIQQFYAGESILITGSTGFLGKTLVEKLLRSCRNIRSVFLLIRAKKGKNMHDRVEELFDDPVFAVLKEIDPKFRHKVQGIAGDCSLPGLGLSPADRLLLITEVSVVFHAAATVKFDEKLRLACAINVKGPRDMLELCREMKHLTAAVHVSTAYANCTQTVIEEKFYATPMDPAKLIAMIDSTDDKLLDNITPMVLKDWPNTYTFTKAVAEDLIRQNYVDLPVGVFRPAIVVSTYREPIKGWVDNMYGPTGICAGAGTGVLRTLPCEPSANANIVPVDMCVNALVCSAWEVYKKHQEIKETQRTKTELDIPIFNYVSSVDNPLNWAQFMDMCGRSGIYYPSSRAIWYYSFTLNRYWPIHLLYVLFLQLIPALVVDGALICIGKPPQLINMNKKIMRFTSIIKYFTVRNWIFSNECTKALYRALSKEDQQLFDFDMTKLDWEEYFKEYVKGIRTYLLKEPLKTLPDALKRWRRLYWMHQISKVALALATLKLCWFIVTLVY